jgi:hypothetical protein
MTLQSGINLTAVKAILKPTIFLAKYFSFLHFSHPILVDYPEMHGYLFTPIFYQTGKGMNSIYTVKSK